MTPAPVKFYRVLRLFTLIVWRTGYDGKPMPIAQAWAAARCFL